MKNILNILIIYFVNKKILIKVKNYILFNK